MRRLDATPDARNFAAPVQFISGGKVFDLARRKYKLRFRLVDGVIAQLVERLNGIQEVRSSSLLGSTSLRSERSGERRLPRRSAQHEGGRNHPEFMRSKLRLGKPIREE